MVEAAHLVLANQEITPKVFCRALYEALSKWQGKFCNIYVHGSSNCGRSFILSPLKVIFNTFSNPAMGSFAWIGAEQAEVIFLNDFRLDPKLIAWADLSQTLEGDVVHHPAPKTFCQRDLELTVDTHFFTMADTPIVLISWRISGLNEYRNDGWKKKSHRNNNNSFLHADAALFYLDINYVNNDTQWRQCFSGFTRSVLGEKKRLVNVKKV